MKLSALILTKNEEDMIEDCLKQLDFVDEIIILDQSSSDNTVKIAKIYTDKILTSTTEDFAQNRNLLSHEAKGEWVLYVDADERLSQETINELEKMIIENRFSAFYFPRKNYVLGKRLKHGGWWPDYVPRLFKKNKLLRWSGRVHESPVVEGPFGYMQNPISHLTSRSMSKMLFKSIKWAHVEAELFYKKDHPKVTIFKTMKSLIREFCRGYFAKSGFLDGSVGLIEAVYQSLHKAMILTYLWELQNDTKSKKFPAL